MDRVDSANGRHHGDWMDNPAVRRRRQRGDRRRSWAAAFVLLALGVAVFLIVAGLSGSTRHPVHLSGIGLPITPTPDSPPISLVPGGDGETVDSALRPADRPLPATQYDLGTRQVPTLFSLSADRPGVRLRLSGQENARVTITLELAANVPRTGVIVRLSRYAGSELQPLLIFKPEELVSLPVDFPIASVDAGNKADLIVDLLTPLAPGEEITFRAYAGVPWPLPDVQASPGGVSCADYPTYCVSFSGGGEGALAAFESPGSRVLDQPSAGSPGVTRGLSSAGAPFIGNPDAPLHLAVFQDFRSIRDSDYYLNDLQSFITNYVLTGQASLEMVFVTDPADEFSQVAAQAAFAAGEQGAFWEMTTALFELAKSGGGPRYAFNWSNVRGLAAQMGLDSEIWFASATSGRYEDLLDRARTRADAQGIDDMPAVLFQTADGDWQFLPDRSYAALSQAARAPELLEQALPVSISLDPEKIDQVSYGLQEGDRVALIFDLSDLDPDAREALGIDMETEQLTFEGLLVDVGWPAAQRSSALVLVVAVPLQDAETVVNLERAEVPLSVQLIQSDDSPTPEP